MLISSLKITNPILLKFMIKLVYFSNKKLNNYMHASTTPNAMHPRPTIMSMAFMSVLRLEIVKSEEKHVPSLV